MLKPMKPWNIKLINTNNVLKNRNIEISEISETMK